MVVTSCWVATPCDECSCCMLSQWQPKEEELFLHLKRNRSNWPNQMFAEWGGRVDLLLLSDCRIIHHFPESHLEHERNFGYQEQEWRHLSLPVLQQFSSTICNAERSRNEHCSSHCSLFSLKHWNGCYTLMNFPRWGYITTLIKG